MNYARIILVGLGCLAPAWLWAQETLFQNETRLATEALPCKWVAMGGRTGPSYGSGRFDFSCKGGTWGTITLLMDAGGLRGNSLSQVRLGYRDWDPAVNPTAGEASVAEQFLQYVLNRFVPAAVAPAVRQGFWQGRPQRWRSGSVRVNLNTEMGEGFVQRWLIVERPFVDQQEMNFGPTLPVVAPWRQPPTDGGLLVPEQAVKPTVRPATPQSPVNLPAPARIQQQGVRRDAPLEVPAEAPAGPRRDQRGEAPQSLLDSAAATFRGLVGLEAKPDALDTAPVLADPARLQTAPAAESLQRAAPPPRISPSLVPSVESVIDGRAPAPTNFAAYNEAQSLTRDLEARAMADRRALASPTQVVAGAEQAIAVSETMVASPTLQVAPLQAPTATVQPPALSESKPVADPRFVPSRDLPQLKFIPKAEPVDTSDDVIRFEDEGSGL